MPIFGLSDDTQKLLLKWAYEQQAEGAQHKITRVAMYKALAGKFGSGGGQGKSVLSISGSGGLARVLGLRRATITEAAYPKYNILDLREFAADSFDFCVSDQVFEHIEGNPFVAFRETVRVTKPGGWLCHTTCFINPVHGHPSDFWRFTPAALELMARDAGCVEISVAGWGNREAWALVEAGLRKMKVPDDPNHPLHRIAVANDPRWPIVVWVTAQKPPA